jgi:hypothetical protein
MPVFFGAWSCLPSTPGLGARGFNLALLRSWIQAMMVN